MRVQNIAASILKWSEEILFSPDSLLYFSVK